MSLICYLLGFEHVWYNLFGSFKTSFTFELKKTKGMQLL